MRPTYNKLTNTLELVSATVAWSPPSDWIDISNAGENEINLLVTDVTAPAFTIRVGSGSGTFSVDWGDGVIQNGLVGNGATVFYHQYTVNGTPCSDGYITWKLRIYNASEDIKLWKVSRSTLTTSPQPLGILSAYINCPGITDYSYMFKNTTGNQAVCSKLKQVTIKSFRDASIASYMFSGCIQLEKVTFPSTWGALTSALYMFNECSNLQYITLPASWGSSLLDVSNMFYLCTRLISVYLPASWGALTNISGMFNNCQSLLSITLPATWGSVTNVSNLFHTCLQLMSITLPASWGSVTNVSLMFYNARIKNITLPDSWGLVTNCSSMLSGCTYLPSVTFGTSWEGMINASTVFNNCSFLKSVVVPSVRSEAMTNVSSIFGSCNNLKSITNIQYLGSRTVDVNFSNAFSGCNSLETNMSIPAKLTAFGVTSQGGAANPITSIRFTHASLVFTGGVDVSYTSLNAAALNLLFGDLPTVTSKTINITGCTGAATCTRSIATTKGWTVTG